MKHTKNTHLKLGVASLCALLAILAQKANAQTQYFTTVVNGGTYSWDDLNWNTYQPSPGANTGPYNSPWVGSGGDFARFYNGAGDTFTVTSGQTEEITGMYLDAGAATLNIVDDGSGNGAISIDAGSTQATQNGFSWVTQGFLTGGGVLNISVPMSGPGGVEEESGGGHLQLYAANSYTGGTLFTSSSTFVDYNNNASFGAATSQIGYDGTTFSIMENTGPSTVNIPNPVQVIGTTGVNFIGNSATSSGNWTLGNNTVNLRVNGAGTTETLSGVMSGGGTLTVSGANSGTLLLSGANTYSGAVVVGSSGDTAITLQLGTANAMGSISKLTLAGGTFNPGGFAQAMSGTLGMTVSSKIDFSAGAAAVSFAKSAGNTWTGVLNLINWSYGDLKFGTDNTGLTSGQLADIEFNGGSLGQAGLDANGFLIQLPEPSTWALGLGGLGVLYAARRRTA